jgi:protein-tyrosine phosphatase
MAADILKINPTGDRRVALQRAAQVLGAGGLVVFPTETVYGVAASAADGRAVQRLRGVKGRAADQPFTVHVARPNAAERFAPSVSSLGRRFMKKGWPGPLTLVFPVDDPRQAAAHDRLSPEGRDAIYRHRSVGLRCPDDETALKLLEACETPVIASSANSAGRPAPTDADAALAELGAQVDLVLDAGRSRYGRASTIVAVHTDRYELVREGVLDERTVRRLGTLNILFVCSGNTCRSPMAEGLCRHWLAKRIGCAPDRLAERGVAVGSCGTSALDGAAVSPQAVEVCRAHGVDIAGHRARGLTADLVRPADYIFTMAGHHRQAVIGLAPEARDRTALLRPDEDIADPMGGDAAAYAACAKAILESFETSLKDVEL